MKIDKAAHVDIIEAYTIDLWPVRKIAEVIHCSPTAIHRFLKKHGVDTTKHKISVSCTTCGKEIKRTKKRVANQRNHFCNLECYATYLNAGADDFEGNRQWQRAAREVVSRHFNLQAGQIVHHKDRNQCHNVIGNLMVFATQGDHIRFHHQMRHEYANPITNWQQNAFERYHPAPTVPILFDGSKIE